MQLDAYGLAGLTHSSTDLAAGAGAPAVPESDREHPAVPGQQGSHAPPDYSIDTPSIASRHPQYS